MNLKEVSIHIIYWLVFFIAYPIFIVINQRGVNGLTLETFLAFVQNIFLHAGTLIPTVYFIFYFLFTRFVLRKTQLIKFFIAFLFVTIILILINNIINYLIIYPIFYPDKYENFKTFAWDPSYLIRTYFFSFLEIIFFAIFKFSKDYFTEYIKRVSIQKEMSEVRLRMLKNQIHPHFLFNTLNNIYTLSMDCKNELLSESIAKLSEMLRFSIYECNKKLIPLEKELTIISNYIELEKLRYSNLDIELKFPDINKEIYVIPMLYFTFIENAFKHGTSKSIKKKWLRIVIEIRDDEIMLRVLNSKNSIYYSDPFNYSNGIGLKNAIKRLEIYFNKKDYNLTIDNNNEYYKVELHHKILNNEGKLYNY